MTHPSIQENIFDTMDSERALANLSNLIAEQSGFDKENINNLTTILRDEIFVESLKDCVNDNERKNLLKAFNDMITEQRERLDSYDSGIGDDDILSLETSSDIKNLFKQLSNLGINIPEKTILEGLEKTGCAEQLTEDLTHNKGQYVQGIIDAYTAQPSDTETQHQGTLEALLHRHNMTLINSVGDGNCMFHSLSEAGRIPSEPERE